MTANQIARVRAAIAGTDAELEFVAETGSTNADLLSARAADLPAAARVRWAGHQVAGRGRRGRQWQDGGGASLCFSIAFERALEADARELGALSLAFGACLAQALSEFAPDIGIKWPNDLLRNERKIAGILVEVARPSRIERVVVGVGINLVAPPPSVASPAPDAPTPLPVGGLFDDMPGSALRADVLSACIVALHGAWHRFLVGGFAAFLEAWKRYDRLAGQTVMVHDGRSRAWEGRCVGVAANGALRVHGAGTEVELVSGEVSIRPASGGATEQGTCA